MTFVLKGGGGRLKFPNYWFLNTEENLIRGYIRNTYGPLCNQLFLNENACSGDKSSAKVLFEHPSTTFVHTKT